MNKNNNKSELLFFIFLWFHKTHSAHSILAPSVTVKAIGLFLKNSALHSRVSSCSSRSSKSTGGGTLDVQQHQQHQQHQQQQQHHSPPLRFYPSTNNINHNKQTIINYHSHGNLTTTIPTRQAFVKTSRSPHQIPTSKSQHSTPTSTNGQKLMPT